MLWRRHILSESFFWTDIITIWYLKSRTFFVSIRFLTLPWLRICLTKTSFHCCTALFHLTLPRTLPDWLSWDTFAGKELPPYDKMNTFLMRYWTVFAQSNAWRFDRALHRRAISVSRVGPRRLWWSINNLIHFCNSFVTYENLFSLQETACILAGYTYVPRKSFKRWLWFDSGRDIQWWSKV